MLRDFFSAMAAAIKSREMHATKKNWVEDKLGKNLKLATIVSLPRFETTNDFLVYLGNDPSYYTEDLKSIRWQYFSQTKSFWLKWEELSF